MAERRIKYTPRRHFDDLSFTERGLVLNELSVAFSRSVQAPYKSVIERYWTTRTMTIRNYICQTKSDDWYGATALVSDRADRIEALAHQRYLDKAVEALS